MIPYDAQKPLFSLHIPKCAGTSFAHVLEQWFGDRFRHHQFDYARKAMPERYDVGAGFCVHGHFIQTRGYGIREYYPDAAQFITVLRNPFDRIVSQFYFLRENPAIAKQHGVAEILEPGYDLARYLHSGHARDATILPFDFTTGNAGQIFDAHFVHVGIFEDVQRSADRLADALGKPRAEVPRLNPTKMKPSDHESLRDEFERSHPLQCSIYREAVMRHAL